MRSALLVISLLSLTTAAHGAESGTVKPSDAWARESLPGKDISAAYLTLTNVGNEADALVGASSEAAKSVELHRMTMTNGTMKMEHVPEITLPAGGKAELAPGGLHMMLFGLEHALEAGDHLQITLKFRRAQPLIVDFEVRRPEPEHDHRSMH